MNYTVDDIIIHITDLIAAETGLSKNMIQADESFFIYGIDSISAVYLMHQLEDQFKITLTPLYFWDYPTIKLFAEKIYLENFSS